MIRNEFVLLGNKADTRNKIGIEDKRLYTLDMDDLQNNPFTIGHRNRGLVSLGHYQAGSEFGEHFHSSKQGSEKKSILDANFASIELRCKSNLFYGPCFLTT